MHDPRHRVRRKKTPTGEVTYCQPLQWPYKAWRTACRKAGVTGRIMHDFRRTAVRNLERAGVSRSTAMKMTGHRTEAVYRRYAIVSDSDLREAAAKLAALDVATAQNPRPRAQ